MKFLVFIFLILNLVLSCGDNTKKIDENNEKSCENIQCGEHGNCVIENNLVKCDCDDGYFDKDLKCLEISELCKDISCGENGDCIVDSQNAPYCECDLGYYEENFKCIREELTKENIKKACEKIIPCNTGGEENIDLCMSKYNSFYHSKTGSIYAYYMPVGEYVNDYILCVNLHETCDDYNSCFNDFMGITYSNESCDNNIETCSDNKTLKICENGVYKYTDCSVVNKKCLEYGDNKAFCSNDVLCEQDSFENYCDENGSLVYCRNGVTQEYYCPYYGQECRVEDNISNCYLKEGTPTCETNNETSCEDGNMILCRDNNKLITNCEELFGENFKCMLFSYQSGDFIKNNYGCFYE